MRFAKYFRDILASYFLLPVPHYCWYHPIITELSFPKGALFLLDEGKLSFIGMLQSHPLIWDSPVEDYRSSDSGREGYICISHKMNNS